MAPSDFWMQTTGADLIAVRLCSPVPMGVFAYGSGCAHGSLYLAAVRDDSRAGHDVPGGLASKIVPMRPHPLLATNPDLYAHGSRGGRLPAALSSVWPLQASRLRIWVIEIATDKEDPSVQAALAEFTALRAEALQAFSMEWNIIALQITATGVLFSFALTNSSRTGFLLIVPIVSFALSGRYLRNDRIFLLIGIYIRTDLNSRLGGGLKWEEWYTKFPNPVRTLHSIAYGPAVFSGISIVALVWVFPYVWSVKHISAFNSRMLEIIYVLDVVATIISIVTIVVTLTAIRNEEKRRLEKADAGTEAEIPGRQQSLGSAHTVMLLIGRSRPFSR